MPDRSRVEFCICTARRRKLGQNIGGPKLTKDEVNTILNLFMHIYRNILEA